MFKEIDADGKWDVTTNVYGVKIRRLREPSLDFLAKRPQVQNTVRETTEETVLRVLREKGLIL